MTTTRSNSSKKETIVYLATSTRSQVATTQHGDHGFPKCRILCPDIRDPITVTFHHFKKMWQHGKHSSFFPEFLGSNDKGNGGIWRPGLIKGEGTLSPPQRATGPYRPLGGDRPPFFSPGTSLRIWRKKITLWVCRPMGGDRGVFLKYCKTDIYFWNFYFFKYKKEKSA